MNETQMTVVGNVVDAPTLRQTKTGHAVTSFRLASTARRFDPATNGWADRPTLFVTVTCWRALAENVVASLRRGDPVVVSGRFEQKEYTKDEVVRFAYELEASAVGHDLSRGITGFERRLRPSGSMTVEADADGLPVDDSEHVLGLVDADARSRDGAEEVEIDQATGEVRAFATAG